MRTEENMKKIFIASCVGVLAMTAAEAENGMKIIKVCVTH
jgi:hypothetical protein